VFLIFLALRQIGHIHSSVLVMFFIARQQTFFLKILVKFLCFFTFKNFLNVFTSMEKTSWMNAPCPTLGHSMLSGCV